ncbi:unnamed protein product [Lactuca virosa]|uniref:Uncharacterized protein n=1 Tax=Lactuca virosa TaxID=75947 RepID=A0AAU9P6D3_9ASTR|nr:unnamed protein product [Lactuca virosa]
MRLQAKDETSTKLTNNMPHKAFFSMRSGERKYVDVRWIEPFQHWFDFVAVIRVFWTVKPFLDDHCDETLGLKKLAQV